MIHSVRCWKSLDFVHFVLPIFAMVIFPVLCGCESQSQKGPGETPPGDTLDAAARREVLTQVAVTIRDHYADRDVGNSIADTILARLEQSRFDFPVVDVDSLVTEVMSVIRAMIPDRHFDFSVRGGPESNGTTSSAREPSEHGLRKTRILEHDTAYLEFDGLPGDDVSMRFVEQALEELPEVKAFILDIRNNIGGSGDMVVLLCSHLLEAGTLLYKHYDRSGNPPGEMKAGTCRRYFGPDIPVYVLTSGTTLSAAEALAYILQDYERATLVGQQTPGMANPSRTFSIGTKFELTVPFLLIQYGKSGGTFAGVGVSPDIVVPPESALEVVLSEIRSRFEPSVP